MGSSRACAMLAMRTRFLNRVRMIAQCASRGGSRGKSPVNGRSRRFYGGCKGRKDPSPLCDIGCGAWLKHRLALLGFPYSTSAPLELRVGDDFDQVMAALAVGLVAVLSLARASRGFVPAGGGHPDGDVWPMEWQIKQCPSTRRALGFPSFGWRVERSFLRFIAPPLAIEKKKGLRACDLYQSSVLYARHFSEIMLKKPNFRGAFFATWSFSCSSTHQSTAYTVWCGTSL